MEITRRFIKFLEELEDPQVQEKYLNHELEDNLRTITTMISKLNISDNKKPSSINDLQIFENTLSDGCHQITKKLRETLEAISALHVYITNFPPNPFNIHRYLTAYCQAIFECASISFISPHVQAIKVMKIFNGQNILDMDTITKIVKELDGLMADKAMLPLEGAPQGALGSFIEKKNSFGNIVVKLEKDQERFYLLMHFDKDSPFTGSFISGKYNEVFPSIFNILTGTLVSVVKNVYPSKMDPLLESLEGLKLELIELYKRYFLSYIATEIRLHLDCEVSTSIIIDQKEEEINSKLAKAEKRSIQLVLLHGNVLQLKNNFQWDNSKLSQRLSSLWNKLKTSTRAKEQRTFYHFSMQNTDHLFLEFNKAGYLVYQNKPVQQTNLKSVVEVGDFLMEPKARSIDEILAQNPKTLEVVKSLVKETEESKSQTVAKKQDLPDVSFEFIGKRKESKKTLEGFAIVFKDKDPPLRKRNSDPLDSLIDDIENCSESYPLDPTFKKVKRLLSVRHVNPKKLLGEHADLSVLKKTIISEYLPEELTSTPEPKAHKSIALVNKIKLDITSKTAFTDSPMHKKFAHTPGKVLTSPFAAFGNPTKPSVVSFSPEALVSRGSDRATLEDWSFDAINIEDPIEKNRLVWAMLDAFDLVKEFNIDLNILCEFITRMKEKYSVNTNSFHNYEHGITVMHGSFYILRHISTKFTNLVNLGILVSAFCHDANHTGRTNIFEVNSGSKLALKYHDKSVLEQHHAATAFKVLSKETCNIFNAIKPEDYKQLRKLIISNILATDMKNHFEVMNTFNDLRSRMDKEGEENFSWGDDDVTVVSNMVVHCSDLCGPTKSFPVAYHWAQRINEEFSIQVREEEALGIPVTPYFRDLDKPEIMAKQEIAFISFMIKPLWESCNKFFSGAMQIAVDNIQTNVKQWNVLLEEALKKKEAEEAANKK